MCSRPKAPVELRKAFDVRARRGEPTSSGRLGGVDPDRSEETVVEVFVAALRIPVSQLRDQDRRELVGRRVLGRVGEKGGKDSRKALDEGKELNGEPFERPLVEVAPPEAVEVSIADGAMAEDPFVQLGGEGHRKLLSQNEQARLLSREGGRFWANPGGRGLDHRGADRPHRSRSGDAAEAAISKRGARHCGMDVRARAAKGQGRGGSGAVTTICPFILGWPNPQNFAHLKS